MNNNCNSDKYVPLDAAKNLIIAALYQYHPELADRAADIFEREGHTIIDNPERVTGMMQCRPAGAEVITDENHDMYISEEDFKWPQQEEQAYFVQSIVSHYTGIPSPENITSDDLKSQFEGSDRPKQFRAAHNRFTDSLSMDSQQRYEQMVMALSGNFDNGGARLQTLTNALANQPANRL